MKLLYKIFFSLLLVLLLATGSMVFLGTSVITAVVRDLNEQLLLKELDTVRHQLEDSYNILKKHGLQDVDLYVESAQKELLDQFYEYHIGDSGELYIISADGSLLNVPYSGKHEHHRSEISSLKEGGTLSDQSGTLTVNLKDGEHFCVYEHFPPWNWVIMFAFHTDEMFAKRHDYIRYISGSVLAIAGLALLIGFFVSRRMTKPLEKIMEAVKKIEAGDMEVQIPESGGSDEIATLQRGINTMTSTLLARTRESREAKELVVHERSLLRALIDSIPDLIFYKDCDSVYIGCNKAFAERMGYPEEELVGKNDHEFFSADIAAFFQKKDQEALALNAPQRNDEWVDYPDGRRVFLHTLKTPFYGSTGNLLGLVGVSRDMTLENSLREDVKVSEEKYREIFNTPSDAIFIHDADIGAILDVNQAMSEMFGYSYDEALQQDVGTLSSGELPYTLEEAIKKIEKAKEEGPQLFEWMSRRENGEIFWSEIGLKHRGFGGKRYVVAVVRDISSRKEAERVLAAEREQLAVTLRSIGDGVITTDIGGHITLINKVADNMTGWSQVEALGKPLEEVFNIINEKTGELAESPLDKVRSTGGIVGLANHTALVARNGSTLSIADSGAPIRDRESRMLGVVIVFRDVTEKNRMEEELLKGRKLESVGVLAGGIAHDFNNILAAILGNISLALTITKPKDEIYELLVESEKATMRAKDLTQQLLTFAKGGDPVRKIAAIDEVIRDSAGFVLRGSNVRCDFKFSEELWPVTIDTGQISQVIQNIIVNASQAMPTGGTIALDCSNYCLELSDIIPVEPGNYIKIAVKDQGVGIPNELLDKIFDPYFTTKQKGSGLGLAITHSIIKKHDGYITVDSELGLGATFTIFLPASEGGQANSQKKAVTPLATTQGKVMIMDDEGMVREIVAKMLSISGYEVIAAKDGDEALKLYQKAKDDGLPIDLIIMDLTIPGGMGGKDAVGKVLQIDPQAKVIVSSGYSNDPVMADFSEYGFLGALVKPFQIQELKGIVSEVMSS